MKPVNNKQTETIGLEIIKVIKYFAFFAYYPTSKEIRTFLQAKISENSLKKSLDKMIGDRLIRASKDTPPQYSIGKKISNNKYQISKKKLGSWRYRAYIKLVSLFPQIRLIGLSGSISMMNAKEDDDIDLFIITAKNRLFTGRAISLVLAQALGLRRKRDSSLDIKVRYRKFFDGKQKTAKNLISSLYTNKVCLNLFFDERNLSVPKFKQTEFVGHEVLQMKPIVNKDQIYERFLEANKWVFGLFPNTKQIFNFHFSIFNEKSKIQNEKLDDWIENQLKKLQMRFINEHKTSEIITDTQLWFHPDDFERKIPV